MANGFLNVSPFGSKNVSFVSMCIVAFLHPQLGLVAIQLTEILVSFSGSKN